MSIVEEREILHDGKDLYMLLTGENEQWISAENPVEARL